MNDKTYEETQKEYFHEEENKDIELEQSIEKEKHEKDLERIAEEILREEYKDL